MAVKFTIYGKPFGKQRPRVANHGGYVQAYTPKETINYENLVKFSYLQECGNRKLEGGIAAEIIGVFPVAKSESKKRRSLMLSGVIPHTKKCDCDNLAKSILDALNGIAYDDDSQICKLTVEKIYGENPRVEVKLEEVQSCQQKKDITSKI